jgi:hypothetical protein
MKGYFSQLARHTGLRFADSRASRNRTIAPVAPLHVEEVAMVSPAMPSAEAPTREEPVAQATVVQKVETAKPPKAEQVSVHELAPTESIEQRAVESVAIERPITSAADNTEIKQDHYESRVEQVEVERAPQTQTPAPVVKTVEQKVEMEAPHEVSEVEITDPVEREVLVRQYLREVRAWVAASPMPEDESVSESQQSWTEQQPESVAFTVARESIPTAQPEPREQIDVHDMNLSIGNISIVIEEPQPAAPAVIAPTPSAPPPQPQTRHEPISLSRYYLRSW